MESTEQLVTSNYVTRFKQPKKLVTSLDIRDKALVIAEGLTSTTAPNDMTGWYCKAFKQLGESKYSYIASCARQGRNPKSLFGYLLKQEMNR